MKSHQASIYANVSSQICRIEAVNSPFLKNSTYSAHRTDFEHTSPITLLFIFESNLDVLVIFDNDLDPLITALTALTRSSLFLVVTVAKVATDKVSRSVMRSIPRRKL